MISRERVIEILEETGALLEGHFLLSSGRHSDRYIQCAKVFQYPRLAEELSGALAQYFKDDDIDIVIGPAIGGIIPAYELGRCLGVKAMFTEREGGVMTLRRGFEIPEGARVIVAEDVVTTGGSVREVIETVRKYKAHVVGVAAIVDRSAGKVDFGTKFRSVISLDVKSYEPENCPVCKEGLPLVKPGSRDMRAV